MKKQVRVIAWDDCAFSRETKSVRVIGVVYRGGDFIDGVLSTHVSKDGNDATDRIASAVTKSRHYDQLSYIMLDGITFAGLNVVDIKKLNRKTKLPVIVIQRHDPDIKKFMAALKIFPDHKERIHATENAGKMLKHRETFYQLCGMNKEEGEDLLKVTCVRSNIPEPLRVAHLIASGLSGESRGRA